uniref:ribosomal protein L20 n=1 Tax=Mimica arnoldii TaxID=88407 RepID=UPI0027A1A098|nr:ribosomal protein L20 [Mimica arnoldii]WGO62543.1 ribosomal protein L20 [Mimica arnoldii]
MSNFKLDKELGQYKTRKKKRYILNNENLCRVNYNNCIKYNGLLHFMRKEKLLLNKSIIVNFVNTESGSLYSLKRWYNSFLHKLY